MFIRRMREHRIGGRRGFTLIELAIVLAVTSLLTAGLWRMMSSGNTQLRDQAAADQHKVLINSVRAYLASQAGQTRLLAEDDPFEIVLNEAAIRPYLPAGFDHTSTNSYGQRYKVKVLKSPATANMRPEYYAFMIKTVNGPSGEAIPDTSGGRISSMIGSDGGFVYSTPVCGGVGGDMACGAFGSWSANPTTYNFGDTAGGQVASRTFVGSSAELDTPWLGRLDMDSTSETIHELNTIQTDISLGGKALVGTADVALASAGSITKLELLELNNFGAPSLDVGRTPSCTKNHPSDSTNPNDPGGCPDVASFNGDISINGLLKTTKLYAEQVIYDRSDRRLKHDIVPFTNALDKMASIAGYSFRMNGSNEQKYGVIAQELEKEFPILVHDAGDGFKGVDYIGLIGPLVAAVNELRQQNIELKKTLEQQGKMIDEMKKPKGK